MARQLRILMGVTPTQPASDLGLGYTPISRSSVNARMIALAALWKTRRAVVGEPVTGRCGLYRLGPGGVIDRWRRHLVTVEE